MPGRLSKLFSRDDKRPSTTSRSVPVPEKQDVVSTGDSITGPGHDHDPPAYQPDDNSVDVEHTLPPPDLTAGFSNLEIKVDFSTKVPTTQECIAHLKLLECFFRLQQQIGSSDGLFGIDDGMVHSLSLPDMEASKLLAKLAEKRWAIYITRAVDRFHAWSHARFPSMGSPSISSISTKGVKGFLTNPRCYSAVDAKPLGREDLPPVDVLLVWHAYMLNPRVYFEDCLRNGRMHLWHQIMPWEAVAASVNSETFHFEPGDAAIVTWMSLLDRDWNNLEDSTEKIFTCPECGRTGYTRWTEVQPAKVDPQASRPISEQLDDLLTLGNGFCDKGFSTACQSCGALVNSERLKVGKFLQDVRALLDAKVPMPGTLFGTRGIPQRMHTAEDPLAIDVLRNTNGILTWGLGAEFLDSRFVRRLDVSMTDVRTLIETKVTKKSYMRNVRGSMSGTMQRHERIAIRRMMSRYWDNNSYAGLDLVGAVVRQCSFTEKMHNIDWLHSPALLSTMHRLITKYKRFVDILAMPQSMAVPTLDVDLAWHTHQLNPLSYCHFTLQETGQFVDHDDKIAEVELNNAFGWTSKQYQSKYGEPYSECTCWYCEAVRESTTSRLGRFFNSPSAAANDKLHASDQDPRKSVHISAHNAVRPTGDKDYDRRMATQLSTLNVAYQDACYRAKRKGRQPPKREHYYYSEAYGYPVYIPAYIPMYGALPYTPALYPIAPGCMALGAGSAGNCCTGTCGASVAAGGCAGLGGACAGGSAGGCGGGSSGGCGGGGGGCGGGGGGGGCGGGGGGC